MGTYNKIDVLLILKDNGWTLHHHNGSHSIYRNEKGQHLSVNIESCNRMILRRLIKQYDLKTNLIK